MRINSHLQNPILVRQLRDNLKGVSFFYPVFIFLISLTIYVRTMPPGIAAVGYSADTLKFQYIGKVLGTPHFGYPTYMFLNILVSRIPLFNLAYRLNLVSAILASATLVALYFIILSLSGKRLVAFACALLFGVTYTFWENSIIAEVYSLNTLFMCAVLLLMLQWRTSVERRTANSVGVSSFAQDVPKQADNTVRINSHLQQPDTSTSLSDRLDGADFHYYLACLVYALSFGNHLIGITMLPALVYWTFAVDCKILLKRKTWLLIAVFVFLGISQYGYVLLRSYQNPPGEKVFQYWPYSEDFGKTHLETNARSIPDLFDKVSGDRWKNRLVEHPAVKSVSGERLTFLRNLFVLQFSPVGAALGLTGIGFAFVRERKRALFFLLMLLSHLAFLTMWAMAGVYGVDVHAIPSYLALTIFIAHNDNLFGPSWFSRHGGVQRAGRICLAVLVIGLAVFLAVSRYHKIDQSKNVWLADMLDAVAPKIPDDSIIFTNHVYATAFWYKLYGENARPGSHITAHPIWTIYHEDLEYAMKHYRNVYYMVDEPYWPILKDMGVNFEVENYSARGLRDYLSGFKPGEIVAAYAVAGDGDAEQDGGFSVLGLVGERGSMRVLRMSLGPLSLRRHTEIEGIKLPADISVTLGGDIYIDKTNCARYRKPVNLVTLDPVSGKVSGMVYVDWKRGETVDPVYLLRVKSYAKPAPRIALVQCL
ncbi:MAG: DUF2723 domain-containing protein [Candidatus Lindowbacteria bacterium]|nr:DUF2723 domain-containing protein [Candidatus Lindowbacteria bacterium]